MLNGSLAVREEEQLVFYERAAETSTILAALEGSAESRWHGQRCRKRTVTQLTESFTVIRIASGLRGYVHRTGRGQLGGHVKARLADLKFLDGARGNIGGGRSHGFVGDVDAVHFNAGSAAETASEGDRRIASFRGVEVLTVLNLHARLKLGQIEEVASVHRQVCNLALRDDALHGRLLGVHLHRAGLNLDHLTGLTDL